MAESSDAVAPDSLDSSINYAALYQRIKDNVMNNTNSGETNSIIEDTFDRFLSKHDQDAQMFLISLSENYWRDDEGMMPEQELKLKAKIDSIVIDNAHKIYKLPSEPQLEKSFFLKKIFEQSNTENNQEVVSHFMDHLDSYRRRDSDIYNGYEYTLNVLATMYPFMSSKYKERTRNSVKDFFTSNKLRSSSPLLLKRLDALDEDFKSTVESIVEISLDNFGLDSRKTLSAWNQTLTKEYLKEEPYEKTKKENLPFQALWTIARLEEYQPGSVKDLNKIYGITCFFRYSPEMLIEQHKNIGKNQHDYVMIIAGIADHNSAFYSPMDIYGVSTRATAQVYEQATANNLKTIVVEGGDQKEILGRLNRTVRVHGQSSMGLVNMHGTNNSMIIGYGNGGQNISIHDLFQQSPIDKMIGRYKKQAPISQLAARKLFKPRSYLVLNSCSTGAPRAIGDRISEFNLHVLAPKAPKRIKKIEIKELDGGGLPIPTVEYLEDGVGNYFPAQNLQ